MFCVSGWNIEKEVTNEAGEDIKSGREVVLLSTIVILVIAFHFNSTAIYGGQIHFRCILYQMDKCNVCLSLSYIILYLYQILSYISVLCYLITLSYVVIYLYSMLLLYGMI